MLKFFNVRLDRGECRQRAVRRQNGNVLFVILICVVLFAALFYAITTSARSGDPGLSRDKAQLIASDVMQYAASIDAGFMRMKTLNGIREWEFDVWKGRPDAAPADLNGSCVSDKCALFRPDGGGVINRNLFYDATTTAPIAAQVAFYSASIRDVGGPLPELIMFKGGLTKEMCQYINFKSGVASTISSTPPGDSHSGATRYVGTLTTFPAATKIFGDTTNTAFRGKTGFLLFTRCVGACVYPCRCDPVVSFSELH